MRFGTRFLLVVIVSMVALGVSIPAHETSAAGDTIYGLSNSALVRFDSGDPNVVTQVGFWSGLQPGENMRAIDFRPLTGELYGIGVVGEDTGRLYKINTANAVATQVGSPFALVHGSSVSMDFNPVSDRIRVVSAADENFRLNPANAAVSAIDPNLAFDPGDVNSAENPQVADVAYTNNFAGAATTTLYGIDISVDSLVQQGGVDGVPSPNTGLLFTVGPLGVNPFLDSIGLDINAGNTAFASMIIGGVPQLYTMDLATGTVTLLGAINYPASSVADITVQPPVPFGDVDCQAPINSVDALKLLRSNAALSYTQADPCADIGVDTLPNGELQGDVNCSNDVNSIDALLLLRNTAALPVTQNEPCPDIGT